MEKFGVAFFAAKNSELDAISKRTRTKISPKTFRRQVDGLEATFKVPGNPENSSLGISAASLADAKRCSRYLPPRSRQCHLLGPSEDGPSAQLESYKDRLGSVQT